MTNPNKAFKGREPNLADYRKQYEGKMMSEGQREVLERQCKEHDISLISLTTRALGQRKKTRDLTALDAGRCIMMASVWENYRRIGEEP